MRDNYSSKIPKSLIPYTLPSNWTWFFWSDIMKSYQQGMIRSNRELGEGNVYYLKMGDLNDNGVVNLTDLSITNATEKEIKEFQLTEGDFLINVRNSRELVGKTCVIRKIDKTILYNHMLVRINNGSPEMNYFINAFLNIPSSKKLLDRIKQGTTTVIALYQRELNQLPIPLPDTLTFNTIISLYKSIDTKIELNNKINRELEAMAKTLYDYWFVQFDFPNEQSKPYKSSGGKMVYNAELKREIPEGWEVGNIGNYCPSSGGFAFKSSWWTNEGVSVVKIKDIQEDYTIDISNLAKVDLTDKKIDDKFKAKPGDILIAMTGATVGKYGIVPITDYPIYVNQRVGYFNLGNEPTEKLPYLINSLNQPYFRAMIFSLASGAAQPNISNEQINRISLIIPDRTIVNKYNLKFAPFYKTILNNQRQNQQLSELRDWLLPMLMNGQVFIST